MIAATIWNQLVLTLQNNSALSEYVKYVFEGQRFNFEPNSLPNIQLEPVRDGEISKYVNNVQDLFLTINIYAFSSNNFHEFPKTIVGGQDYKGVLDINNDIRACLIASNTLGDNVIDIQIQPTEFDTIDIEKYPVRGMMMPIKILYRQQNGV